MTERRYTAGVIEARSNGGPMTIAGHASVFDTPYELYGFREQVQRGAFKKTLKESQDIAALWNHDPNVVLGRNRSGTLRLSEDDTGLHYEVDLPDTQAARDLYTLIERGDVYQSSFAFEIVKEKWDQPEDKNIMPLRTIREVKLFDVSPVTYPASPSTDVDVARAVRCLAEAMGIEQTDATTVPEVWALSREAATPEPVDDPPQAVADSQPEPEPQRIHPIIVKGLNG